MKAYKIMNKDGLYSVGGRNVGDRYYGTGFGTKGKTWTKIGSIKAHLAQYIPYWNFQKNGWMAECKHPYKDCVLVEIECECVTAQGACYNETNRTMDKTVEDYIAEIRAEMAERSERARIRFERDKEREERNLLKQLSAKYGK